MPEMDKVVMNELRDIDIVSDALEPLGFRRVGGATRWNDSGHATFTDGQRTLIVEKDRGQWMVAGTAAELETFGLARPCEHTGAFCEALLKYLNHRLAD